jgi:hypothetical protein
MNKQDSTVEKILPVYFSVSLTALNGTKVTDIKNSVSKEDFSSPHAILFYSSFSHSNKYCLTFSGVVSYFTHNSYKIQC